MPTRQIREWNRSKEGFEVRVGDGSRMRRKKGAENKRKLERKHAYIIQGTKDIDEVFVCKGICMKGMWLSERKMTDRIYACTLRTGLWILWSHCRTIIL